MRKLDNLPPYSAVVKKSRSLNFLDPSGPAWPVRVCFTFALPFVMGVVICVEEVRKRYFSFYIFI